jgi:hypothetical protein
MRGLGTVTAPLEKGAQWAGQKTTDITGSPAAGAAVYTGLNVFDPEMLAPGAAKVAALRGASRIAREGARDAVPMSEALSHIPKGQRGAYTQEDIAGVTPGPLYASTVVKATAKLKPQEARGVPGKQMLQALIRSGAKKEEVLWSGLDKFLDTDEKITPQDVTEFMHAAGPDVAQVARGRYAERQELSPWGTDAKNTPQHDPDMVKADHELWDMVNSEMPEEYDQRYIVRDQDGDYINEFDNEEDAQAYIDEDEDRADYYVDEDTQDTPNNQDDRDARFAELRDEYIDPDDLAIKPNPSPKFTQTGVQDTSPDHPQDTRKYAELQTILTREGRYGRGNPVDAYGARMKAKYGDMWSTQMTPTETRAMAQLQALVDERDPKAVKPWEYASHFPEKNVLSFTQLQERTHAGQPAISVESNQSDWAQKGAKEGYYDPDLGKRNAAKLAELEGPEWRDVPYENYRKLYDEAIALDPSVAPHGSTKAYYDYINDIRSGNGSGHNPFNTYTMMQYIPAGMQELIDALTYRARRAGSPDMRAALEAKAQEVSAARDAIEQKKAEFEAAKRTLESSGGTVPRPWEQGKQWARMELLSALRHAVSKGAQYLTVTPGNVQSPHIWPEDTAYSYQRDPSGRHVNIAHVQTGYDRDKTGGLMLRARGAEQLANNGPDQTFPLLYEGMPEDERNAALMQRERVIRSLAGKRDIPYTTADEKAKAAAILTKQLEAATDEPAYFGAREFGMRGHYDTNVPSALRDILKEAGSTGSGKGVQMNARADFGMPIFENTRGAGLSGTTPRYETPFDPYDPSSGVTRLGEMENRARREAEPPAPEPEPQELGLQGPNDWLETLLAPVQQRLPLGNPAPSYFEHPSSRQQHIVEIDPELARKIIAGGFNLF